MKIKKKPCRACGDSKALALFHRDPKSDDGRRSKCKSCDAKRKKSKPALQSVVQAMTVNMYWRATG